MRRVALTACCCIKNRCVAFIERKSRPSPSPTLQPAKKEELVKEIIAELGKMETGKNYADAGNVSHAQVCDIFTLHCGVMFDNLSQF